MPQLKVVCPHCYHEQMIDLVQGQAVCDFCNAWYWIEYHPHWGATTRIPEDPA